MKEKEISRLEPNTANNTSSLEYKEHTELPISSHILAERILKAKESIYSPATTSNPSISSESSEELSEEGMTVSQQVAVRKADKNLMRERLRMSIKSITEGLIKGDNNKTPISIKEESISIQKERKEEWLEDNVKEEDMTSIQKKHNVLKSEVIEVGEERIITSQTKIINQQSKLQGKTLQKVNNKHNEIKQPKLTKRKSLVNKKLVKVEKGKRQTDTKSKEEFFGEYGIETEEELNITSDQKQILELFPLSFKRHKGSRALILEHELTQLKQIPMKYKEMKLPLETDKENLDICLHLGEKVHKTEECLIWKQVDIVTMKKERKEMAAIRREMKMNIREKIKLIVNGDEREIGEKSISRRRAVEELDEGRVRLLYHGNNEGLNVYVYDILSDGELIKEVKDDKMVILLLIV